MLALVLAAALASTTDVANAGPAVPPSVRNFDVFVAPVPTVLLSFYASTIYSSSAFYLPTGMTVLVGKNWGITAEVAAMWLLGARKGWGVSASVGPTWLPSGRGVDGWFLTPKVTFDVSRLPTLDCFLVVGSCQGRFGVFWPPITSVDVLAGIDVGYQFAPAPLAVALLFGASVGYGSNPTDPGVVTPLIGAPNSEHPSPGPVWALNLAMVRLGFGG